MDCIYNANVISVYKCRNMQSQWPKPVDKFTNSQFHIVTCLISANARINISQWANQIKWIENFVARNMLECAWQFKIVIECETTIMVKCACQSSVTAHRWMKMTQTHTHTYREREIKGGADRPTNTQTDKYNMKPKESEHEEIRDGMKDKI